MVSYGFVYVFGIAISEMSKIVKTHFSVLRNFAFLHFSNFAYTRFFRKCGTSAFGAISGSPR